MREERALSQNSIYPIEELIPIVEVLADKYTSKESSSVSYDTAEMLMEAVVYCLDEYKQEKESSDKVDEDVMTTMVPFLVSEVSSKEAYECGYQLVLDKVYEAKELYHTILKRFEGYGCKNYIDTVQKGMPAFFQRYDPKFRPQDHILTLDYPTLNPLKHSCGVDAIYEYLQYIQMENEFLNVFPYYAVERLLHSIDSRYEKRFMDNICYVVLERAVWCMLTENPVTELSIQESDMETIKFILMQETERKEELIDLIETKIVKCIHILLEQGFKGNTNLKKYFEGVGRELAVRLYYTR